MRIKLPVNKRLKQCAVLKVNALLLKFAAIFCLKIFQTFTYSNIYKFSTYSEFRFIERFQKLTKCIVHSCRHFLLSFQRFVTPTLSRSKYRGRRKREISFPIKTKNLFSHFTSCAWKIHSFLTKSLFYAFYEFGTIIKRVTRATTDNV